MSIAATKILQFLSQHDTVLIERHEIECLAFSKLRHALRRIVVKLSESEEVQARETCGLIRACLSEWLTVPIPFESSVFETVASFASSSLNLRWGADIRDAYEIALSAARVLPPSNLLRENVASVLTNLFTQKTPFRIFCHKKARQYYESMVGHEMGPHVFLHSVKDYRESELFDVLIKVGPFRSRGWGAAPDALLTAPRFSTIKQFVWIGCSDEVGFGYDPVNPPPDMRDGVAQGPSDECVLGNQITRSITITRAGESATAEADDWHDTEEFDLFPKLIKPGEKQKVFLIQIDDEHGILYPKYSQVIAYDPNDANDPISTRFAGDSLSEDAFLIRPILSDINLGGIQAEEGYFSKIWKKSLREELQINPSALCRLLRNKGIDLLHLRSCLENWAKPATGVIHAPQLAEHFRILIDVLAITEPQPREKSPFWERAWREIRLSRGDAIHAGFQEQEIVQEQSVYTLRQMLPKIREKAEHGSGFSLTVPAGHSLTGAFLFSKVLSIEGGFLAPDSETKVVRELRALEQWRAY